MQRQQGTRVSQNNYSRRNQQKTPFFDFSIIIRYIAIWILLALISFGVKHLVMIGISMSPTGYVGNGFLTLSEVHNTGAAFNLFSEQPEMIIIASFFAVAIMAFIVLVTSSKQSPTAVSAMSALSAGITLNMLERIEYGYVIDYIHCNFAPNIPVFNVPDIFIVVGAISLILSVLTKK